MNKNQQITTARLKIRFFWQYCLISTYSIQYNSVHYIDALLWDPLLHVIPRYSWARAKIVFLLGKPCTRYHNHPLHHDYYAHVLPLEKTLNTEELCCVNLNFLPIIVYDTHYNAPSLLSCMYTFPSLLHSLWCYDCCYVSPTK